MSNIEDEPSIEEKVKIHYNCGYLAGYEEASKKRWGKIDFGGISGVIVILLIGGAGGSCYGRWDQAKIHDSYATFGRRMLYLQSPEEELPMFGIETEIYKREGVEGLLKYYKENPIKWPPRPSPDSSR